MSLVSAGPAHGLQGHKHSAGATLSCCCMETPKHSRFATFSRIFLGVESLWWESGTGGSPIAVWRVVHIISYAVQSNHTCAMIRYYDYFPVELLEIPSASYGERSTAVVRQPPPPPPESIQGVMLRGWSYYNPSGLNKIK